MHFHFGKIAGSIALVGLIACTNPASDPEKPGVTAPLDSSTATWSVVGTAKIGDQEVDGQTVAVRNGVPYIAFRGHTNYKPSVYRLNGQAWSLVGAADFSSHTASDYHLGLGFSSAGEPLLATKGGTNAAENDNYRPTLFRYADGAWTGSIASPSGSEYARFSAFSSDGDINGAPVVGLANGDVLVAYAVEGGASGEDYHVKVRKLASGTWSTVFLSSSAGHEPSLAVLDGVAYVAYRDEGASHKASVYAIDTTGVQAQGTVVGAAGFTTGEGHSPTLRAANGRLYVAVRDHSDYRAHVWSIDPDSAAWQEVGGTSLAELQGNAVRFDSVSMDVTSEGKILVVAQNEGGDNDYRVSAYKYVGSSWSKAGGDVTYSGVASRPRVAIASGTPYVIFQDESNSNGATVVRLQ